MPRSQRIRILLSWIPKEKSKIPEDQDPSLPDPEGRTGGDAEIPKDQDPPLPAPPPSPSPSGRSQALPRFQQSFISLSKESNPAGQISFGMRTREPFPSGIGHPWMRKMQKFLPGIIRRCPPSLLSDGYFWNSTDSAIWNKYPLESHT